MKNVTKLLLVLSVFALGFSSCSKEKRIERHLHSRSGKWNNTVYDYKYYNNGVLETSINYVDAGYIEFDKDGTYVWTFIADGETEIDAGTWENSEDDITLFQNSFGLKFKILEESRKDMKLEYTETVGTDREVYVLTFEKYN